MTSIIEDLIGNSKSVITADRKSNIEKIFVVVEQFLSENEIPVDSNYDEIDFYKYNAYPMLNYNYYLPSVRQNIVDPDVRVSNFIYNYIFTLTYKNYTVVNFTNIFWPHLNHKYRFLTYEAPARLNKEIKMKYIHPKYSLEEVYRRLYCPEYFEKLDDLHKRKNQLLQLWSSLSGRIEYVDEIIDPTYSKIQLAFMSVVNKLFIKANYDDQIPIYITDRATIEKAKLVLATKFTNLTTIENSSKSFFDPRTINYVFKVNNLLLAKVWVLMDNEVIPVLPLKKDTAHIAVCIKLALTEHITYEILGIDNIASNKLKLFTRLISKEKMLKQKGIYTKIQNCKYVGTFYPLDKYLSTQRTDEIIKNIHERNK